MQKVWQVRPGGKESLASVEQVVSLLFNQRGISPDVERSFLEPRYDHHIHDPYLLADMEKAVDRIYQAIEKDEHILIYGDYDVDGVSSTAIMITVLKSLGAKVVPFIPDRNGSGYGLDKKVLQELAGSFDLLITVDCGVGNGKEIEWLGSMGKETIVVDHHVLPDKLPNAVAVLHPCHPDGNYPFKFLCGAGMSWKLAAALLRDKRCRLDGTEERIKEMMDLVCLGTIADMVPLIGENRTIVKYGLKVLARSRRQGIQTLVGTLGVGANVNVDSVSFRLGPLINAAGRIDHAQPALDLLLEDDIEMASGYLSRLKELNNERRRVALTIQKAAEQDSGENAGPVVFAANMGWPVGVVGLVAGKLCERFGKPAVVVGGANGRAVGSARAPEGVNILELLRKGEDCLVRLGGHERAAGFTVKKDSVDNFREVLAATGGDRYEAPEIIKKEKADLMIRQGLIGWGLVEVLRQMEPFGQGNEQPRFILENVYLGDWRKVGKTGEHAKMAFNINDELIDGIGFGIVKSLEESGIKAKELVDVLGSLEVNEYNGRRMLQVRVIDMAKAGKVKIEEKTEIRN